MGETTKAGDASKPSSSSSSPPKDSLDHHHHHHHNIHHHHHQPFLPPPIYIPAAAAPSPPPPPPFQSNPPIIPKRPRYGSSDSAQWTTLPSSALASSTETPGSSPPLSPQLQEPTNTEKQPETESFQHKYRKGKYVSPVWKPNEMLWLARAWRVQYQQQTGSGSGSGENPETSHSGKGKTRADKDREVAEFLNRHGINRDAKTAGTKWDNMLGEFRKVYEWERSGDVEKSYFRLSPYERKQHKLPASFDEQVFQELSHFMASRARTPNLTRAAASLTLTPPHPPPPPLITSRNDDDSPFPSIGNFTFF